MTELHGLRGDVTSAPGGGGGRRWGRGHRVSETCSAGGDGMLSQAQREGE